MRMFLAYSGLTACLAILPITAHAQDATSAPDFATKASVSNTFEIEEAKLALKQATEPKLKAFARQMIHDHTMAEKKLSAAAKGSGGTVEMKLDDPHQAMVTALQGKTGSDFDKAYVADQVQSHQDAASLLQSYEKSGDNAKLKTWAKATLPKVEMHLRKVQAMA